MRLYTERNTFEVMSQSSNLDADRDHCSIELKHKNTWIIMRNQKRTNHNMKRQDKTEEQLMWIE